MKAADAYKVQPPPHVVTLPPTAFVVTWAARPVEPYDIGLRLASAAEHIQIAAEATVRTNRLMHDMGPGDPRWMAVYEVCRIHYLLGLVMTAPDDVMVPRWRTQDGSLVLLDRQGEAKPGEMPVVSVRFSDEGVARMADEYEALSLRLSPTWERATDDELQRLGERLVDGSFMRGLEEAKADAEVMGINAQIRRLFSYIIHLRGHGIERGGD